MPSSGINSEMNLRDQKHSSCLAASSHQQLIPSRASALPLICTARDSLMHPIIRSSHCIRSGECGIIGCCHITNHVLGH